MDMLDIGILKARKYDKLQWIYKITENALIKRDTLALDHLLLAV